MERNKSMDGKTVKDYAKEAKKRLKSGFWQKHNEEIDRQIFIAKKEGVPISEVVLYYSKKAESAIKNSSAEDEAFYEKVKDVLNKYGEVGNIIGLLTDKEYYDNLSYEQKQRYTLELSEKYRKAKERYYEEIEYEKALSQGTKAVN